MKFLILFFLISFSVYSAQIHLNSNINKTNTVDFNTGSRMFFGTGYDVVSNDTKGDCVEINAYQTEPIDSKNSIYQQTYSIELIDSYQGLARSLQVNASASLKMGWSPINAMASYVESQKINNYSLYILIKAELITHFRKAINLKLKNDYLEKLTKDMSSFRRSCGDEYVRSVMYGGSYYAVIRLDTNNTIEQKDLRADIRVKIGTFSSALQMKQTLEKILKGKTVKMLTHKVGGIAVPFATDVDQMLSQVINFPKEVVVSPSPIKAYTSEYTDLVNYPIGHSQLDTVLQQENMMYLGQKRLELIRLRNNILYILENSEQFNDFNKDDLQNYENQINLSLNLINLTARRCFTSLDNCHLPEKLIYPNITFPKRIAKNIVSKCFVTSHDVCGFLYREDRSEHCSVEEYFQHRDQACGVESFKQARTSHCGVELFNSKRDKICGVELYKNKYDESCGCKVWSYESPPWNEHFNKGISKFSIRHCELYNSCRKKEFGVEKYKDCRDKSFGVQSYKVCRNPFHGIDTYKLCDSSKAKTYKICRHSSHGIQSVNECLVKTVEDLISREVVFKKCEME